MLYAAGPVIIIRAIQSPPPMRSLLSSFPRRRGFTLLELSIVVTIVVLLCLMAFRAYSIYVKKGESGACVQKIANFGKALQGYVTDNNQWPQEDVLVGPNGGTPDEDELWDWWFKQLKPHGLSEDDWYCPADLAMRKKEREVDEKEGKSDSKHAIKNPSYIPAKFGPGPYAPYEVPNHPWAIEARGHYDGMNKVMPNGTVQKELNFKAMNRVPAGGAKK